MSAMKTAQEKIVQSAPAACIMKMVGALVPATGASPVMDTVGAGGTLHVAASTVGLGYSATRVLQDASEALATVRAQMTLLVMVMVCAGLTDLAFAILDLAVPLV